MALYGDGINCPNKLKARLLSPFLTKIVILLYHRVAEALPDPQLLCVKPTNFTAHLGYLRRNFDITSLSGLAEMLMRRELPKRETAVITFDDGYADNLYNAKPLLERYEAPATIFVTSGYLKKGGEFWWSALERLLLKPGLLPRRLKVVVNEQDYQWDLGDAAEYNEDLCRRHQHWNILEKADPTPRHYVYRLLSGILEALPEQKRRKALSELSALYSGNPSVDRDDSPISSDELIRLAECRLIEIGAHTITHQILSLCTESEQETEIVQSKACLEELLGTTIKSFSYPHGRPSDYTRKTIDIVRKAGFISACCAYAGIIWQRSDCLQLPRLLIRDYDITAFAAHLKKGSYG